MTQYELSDHIDPTIERDLSELGKQDPVFGPSGEFDLQTPEEKLASGLFAVAQAAHDQIFGQGEQRVMTATGEEINYAIGKVITYDEITNTYFNITASDNAAEVTFRIRSASPIRGSATTPVFSRRHDMKLTYDGTAVTDDFLSATRFQGPISTAAFDAKRPGAFEAMASSMNRSTATGARKFERAYAIAIQESDGTQLSLLGRIATLLE